MTTEAKKLLSSTARALGARLLGGLQAAMPCGWESASYKTGFDGVAALVPVPAGTLREVLDQPALSLLE